MSPKRLYSAWATSVRNDSTIANTDSKARLVKLTDWSEKSGQARQDDPDQDASQQQRTRVCWEDETRDERLWIQDANNSLAQGQSYASGLDPRLQENSQREPVRTCLTWIVKKVGLSHSDPGATQTQRRRIEAHSVHERQHGLRYILCAKVRRSGRDQGRLRNFEGSPTAAQRTVWHQWTAKYTVWWDTSSVSSCHWLESQSSRQEILDSLEHRVIPWHGKWSEDQDQHWHPDRPAAKTQELDQPTQI